MVVAVWLIWDGLECGCGLAVWLWVSGECCVVVFCVMCGSLF